MIFGARSYARHIRDIEKKFHLHIWKQGKIIFFIIFLCVGRKILYYGKKRKTLASASWIFKKIIVALN